MARDGGVGEEVETAGFGIGIAPKESKPTNKLDRGTEKSPDPWQLADQIAQEEDKLDMKETGDDEPGARRAIKELRPYIPWNQAFIEYKQSEGKSFEENIWSNQMELKEKKDEFNQLKEQCNWAKNEIDSIKTNLDKKNDQKQKTLELEDGLDVIDEEEFNMIKEMKEFKKSYWNAFDKLKNIKGDIFFI